MLPEFVDMGAEFDEDRRYRYLLWRRWSKGNGRCCFVMLNPSTADENVLDPTVTRCVGFARDWGFSSLSVVNIFALRSTNPRELYRAFDPVGPQNDRAIAGDAMQADLVVCAWGTHGVHMNRGKYVMELLKAFEPVCLGLTKGGQPRHPLYLKKSTERRKLTVSATVGV